MMFDPGDEQPEEEGNIPMFDEDGGPILQRVFLVDPTHPRCPDIKS